MRNTFFDLSMFVHCGISATLMNGTFLVTARLPTPEPSQIPDRRFNFGVEELGKKCYVYISGIVDTDTVGDLAS